MIHLWNGASPYGDVILGTGSGVTTSYLLAGTELLYQRRNGVTSYYLQDGQGSTRALTSGSGNITDTYTYTAFGETLSHVGTTINAYQYTGQQFDSVTGLYSLRARYYNPMIGRFLSQDSFPINFNNPIELNRYVYTANNPINASDPTGHQNFVEYETNTAKKVAAVGAGAGVVWYVAGHSAAQYITIAIAGLSPLLLMLIESLIGVGTGIDLPPGVDRVPSDYPTPSLERVMNLEDIGHHLDEIPEHQNGKSQISQASQGLGQALVIARQTPKAGGPGCCGQFLSA